MRNIFIVPTKHKSIYWINSNGKLCMGCYTSGSDRVHIYITSDEEIKIGDWCYLNKEGKEFIYKCKEKPENPERWGLKIILTTDSELIADGVQAIYNEFLEWFVKNPSCEEVEVDFKYKNCIPDLDDNGNKILRIKIPSKSENLSQIIPKEEPNVHDYICPQTKKQCDDECCVSAEDCHIEAWKSIISDSKEEQTVKVIQTKEDADIFSKELKNPSEPNEKLKKAIRKQEKRSKLNLTQLSQNVDDALDKETKESMSQWLKEKRQQETLEEFAERLADIPKHLKGEKYKWSAKDRLIYNMVIEGVNWQAERTYSEEETYRLLHNLMSSVSLGLLKINDDMDLKEWFNKNKK